MLDGRYRPIPLFLLEAWYQLNARVAQPVAAPDLGPTWIELHPGSLLLENPDRWTDIARQPDLIPAAVQECLRYDPSVPVWRRVTTRPVTLGGVALPAGARLFLWLAAAGRDAAAFARPAEFDVHRADAEKHLAFGLGLHYCLGANLGKCEAQIAVAELARRYPRLRLAPGQQFTFHPNISFRGPEALRVRTA